MRRTEVSHPAGEKTQSGLPHSNRAGFAPRINRGLQVEVEHGIVIVTPSRDLGTLRYQEIHLEVGRINDLLRHGGFQQLLIDLSERHRLENVILAALVGFCRSIPGNAAFCNVSEKIQESMQTANLLKLWPIYANRTLALQSMSWTNADSKSPERKPQ